MTHEELWQRVLEQIEKETTRASFATWFQNTSLDRVDGGYAVVSVPNAFTKDWLEKKYHRSIIKTLRDHEQSIRGVSFSISSSKPPSQRQQKKAHESQSLNEEQLDFKEFAVDRETNLNPKYTFDSFVVGSFNELANAAARSITENPGKLYNPFFIYGGVGLGKTHLLQSIGNELRKRHAGYKVLYTTSERFMNELITIIQNHEPLHTFKDKYRNVDLLIVDDIQFIAGKAKTEEEFFHTFNALYENGKQIILSSDRPPQAIQNLEDRLCSRFQMGMVADIGQPEYEARLAILKNKLTEKQYALPDNILEYIASLIQRNVRELEGALNILIAKAKVKSGVLSLEEVKQTLEQLSLRSQRIVTTSQIIKCVGEFYGVDEKDLMDRSRKREVVKPRQIAMYLLREDFHGSYPFIGQKLGGRDHTTALHAYEKLSRELKKDAKLVEELRMIRERLYKNA